MKKIISTVIALTMAFSLCAVMPVGATKTYDSANNTFSVDFENSDGSVEGDSTTTTVVNVSTEGNADNMALKIPSNASWRPEISSDTRIMVSGYDVVLNFKMMIDASSDSDITGAMRIHSGISGALGETDNMMKISKTAATNVWSVSFMSTGRGQYVELCEINAGEWVDVSLVLDLEEGKYDVYANGNGLKELTLGEPSGATSVKGKANLMRVTFNNTNSENSAYYIDDIFAYSGDELVMDFEDGSDAIGCGNLSGNAQIVTTNDKNAADTKALYMKYDGLGNTTVSVTSGWNIKGATLIPATCSAIGVDFKIDGYYSKAGKYESRFNPAYPTLFTISTDAGESTPLVAAKYNAVLDSTDGSLVSGEKKWEICFSDGRLNFIGTGILIDANEWVSIDVVVDIDGGTFDGYVNGVLMAEGYKIGHITSSSEVINNGTYVKQIAINNINTSHYNANVNSTYGYYIDNVTYDTFEWQNITAGEGVFTDVNGNVATAGNGRKYSVKISNPNKLTEKTYIAMRALDADGLMRDIIFREVTLPIGEETLEWSFNNLDDDEVYDVKAFFIDPETLTPYSSAFVTIHLPLEQ